VPPTDTPVPATETPLPEGSIGDFVWYDRDVDCWPSGDEQGIDGVELELWYDEDGDGLLDETIDTYLGSTTTAGGGYYLFDGLPRGDYLVNVVESTLPDDVVLTTGVEPYPVSLATGEIFLDADFGYVVPGAGYEDDDGDTGGDWDGEYGDCAYIIAGGALWVPGIEFQIINCMAWVYDVFWSAIPEFTYGVEALLPTDQRALQHPDGDRRRPTTLFDEDVAAVDIAGLPVGSYEIAIYVVDYDYGGRQEVVAVQVGSESDSVTLTSFTDGYYLLFGVGITDPNQVVTIAAANAMGQNAVISGVFIDAAGSHTGVSYLGADTGTQGDWIGAYGGDYYLLLGHDLQPDIPKQGASYYNPGWVVSDYRDLTGGTLDGSLLYQVNGARYPWSHTMGDLCGNAQAWIWPTPWDDDVAPDPYTIDVRALLQPDGIHRIPSTWDDGSEMFPGYEYPNMYIYLTLPLGYYRLALYGLDFDTTEREQVYNLYDSDTGELLDSHYVELHGQGIYTIFMVTGPINLTIEVVNTAGANAVLSGIFVDCYGTGCDES
jgi:hypothetical protein